MKWFLAKVILLAVLVGLILGLQSLGGAVTLWWDTWRFDVALSTAILAVGLLVIVLVSLIRIWGWLGRLPQRIRDYRLRSHEVQRIKKLADLTLDFLEGRYTRVIKSAESFDKEFQDLNASQTSVSRMVAVLAARAAHRLRDIPLRDQWLEKARAEPSRWSADHLQLQGLTQAEFFIEDHDGGAAVRVLEPLLKGDRRHIHGTRLLMRACELTGQWSEVIRLVRLLENRKALHQTVVEKVKRSAYAGLLKAAAANPTAIKAVVDKMSSAERTDPHLAAMVARAWIRESRHSEARQILEAALKAHWDPHLVEVYADCADNPREQFARLEQWAQSHPESFELCWAMGRLSHSQGLWGKAELHLQRASILRPSVRVSLARAEVADAQGKVEEARQFWLQAARLAESQRVAA